MKEHSSSSIFPFSWSRVVSAFCSRYPNNFSQHVMTEDTIEQELGPNGCLRIRKLCTKVNKVPRWGEIILKLAGASPTCGYVIEDILLNPSKKQITVLNYNISHRHIMVIEELVKFRPLLTGHPSTVCEKFVKIKSTFHAAHSALESFGLKRYKKNTVIADKGLLDKLNEVNQTLATSKVPLQIKKRRLVPLINAAAGTDSR